MSTEKKSTEPSNSLPASPPPPFDSNENSSYYNNTNDGLPAYTNNKIESEEIALNNKSKSNTIESAFKKNYKQKKCCCCYIPACLCWCCSIFCCVFLSIIISLAIIVGVNVKACNDLIGKIDTAAVQTFTYDPNVFTTFKVDSRKNLITLKSDLVITQSNTTTTTNTTVNVRIASTKSGGSYFNNAPESADTYLLSIIRPDISDKWGWTSYLSISGQCVVSRVEVVMPQNLIKAAAIETDNYDIIVAGHPVPYTNEFSASTFNGDIHVKDFSAKAITLKTMNGDIASENLNAASATFGSTNGDISVAKLINLENSLSATTTNGNINMDVDIKTAKSPIIGGITTNGDISFKFDSTFSGTYSLSTTNGDVTVAGASDGSKSKTGNIGSGASSLKVQSTNGDISINF